MAKAFLKKINLYVHRDEKDELLKLLQDEAIVHISEVKEELKEAFTEITEEELTEEPQLEDLLRRLENAIRFLEPYSGGKSFIDSLFEAKKPVGEEFYRATIEGVDASSLLLKVETIQDELNRIGVEESNLLAQRAFILPWVNFEGNLEEIKPTKDVNVIPGTIPSRNLGKLEDKPVAFELVNDDGKKAYLIVVYLFEEEEEAKKALYEAEFEQVEFHGYSGKPASILDSIDSRLREIEQEKQNINEMISDAAREFDKLLVLYDHFKNLLELKLADNKGIKTRNTVILEGWVRTEDYEKLKEVAGKFHTAYVEEIEPEPGEEAPVLLENKKVFEPFSSLVKLYGLPGKSDPDPTVIMAPFLSIFFALCLTDAGYGIALMLISYFMMKKYKASRGLMWMLFVGGFFTIFAGILTGGWFGDFTARANWGVLEAVRQKLMWFDPLQETMTFFALALALGFIQILFGLGVGAYKRIRDGDILGGISNEITWIFILLGLAYKGVLAKNIASPILDMVSLYIIIIALALLVLFSGGRSKNFLIKLVKGLYNVYGGISFIGDLLSYVRLMALGLVTAGIAMAVNILTIQVFHIPILGFILAPLLFVFGHLFSIFVNVMGAFVHSLRLQYVEFFTKFYENGGKPFKPFGWEGAYTEIVSNKIKINKKEVKK